MSLQAEKRALRGQIITLRKGWDAAYRAAAAAAVTAALAVDSDHRQASQIMAFCAMTDELATRPLLEQILAAGKTLLLPRCFADRSGFEAVAVADLDRDLRPGPLPGLLDPCPDLPAWTQPIALILVPGLAFDARGYRLGYGKGMYDRFLAARPETPTVGLAFSGQLVTRVPADAHDIPMSRLLTERGWHTCH